MGYHILQASQDNELHIHDELQSEFGSTPKFGEEAVSEILKMVEATGVEPVS